MILGNSNKIRDDNDPMGRDVNAYWGRNKKWFFKSNITDEFEALYDISKDPFCNNNVIENHDNIATLFRDKIREKYLD